MPATIIVGAQWGDEGKGKVVDFVAGRAAAVVRGQGGSNAGHTVRNDQGEFKLHAVPSGIFHDGVTCVMGPGTVIDPDRLVAELAELHERGVDTDRLVLSERAHLVMPYHLVQEQEEEASQGKRAIGTTGRGIGPCYADKAGRFGITMGDLLDPSWLAERLGVILPLKERLLSGSSQREALSRGELTARCQRWAEALGEKITDTTALLSTILGGGGEVLLEGQLGAMRDLDHGIYPFVTSSAPTAAGLCQGSGVPITSVDRVVGIVKAYSTSVGAGPMVCELHGDDGEHLRQLGHEFGASTGRPRRCGWLDLPALRTSARLNGYTGLVLTRLDVLDSYDELRVCTAYELPGGERIDFAPSTALQERATPVYETVAGWHQDTTGARRLEELPSHARAYVDVVAETMSAPVQIVSVGPDRDQTVVVDPCFSQTAS